MTIVYTSLASKLFGREIILRNDMLKAGSHEIRSHIGEIGITTIDILCGKAVILQRTRYGIEIVSLARIFHKTHVWLGWKAAKDRHESSVGAEAIGIEMIEVYALF